MSNDHDRSVARKKALDLLAYREHSAHEMREKLRSRGFEDHLIEYVLEYLVSNDYVSDTRFAEMFVRQRVAKGFGELDVKARLRERGISSALAMKSMNEFSASWESSWQQHAFNVLERKTTRSDEPSKANKERLVRFMQRRGFTSTQIIAALKELANVFDSESKHVTDNTTSQNL